ncbi:AaceriADR416Wp [[Ashbya] aceris (nom. inval.)]|nr:AaceriADR416Wp [[Ashbya] aceris (nom. inval.)]
MLEPSAMEAGRESPLERAGASLEDFETSSAAGTAVRTGQHAGRSQEDERCGRPRYRANDAFAVKEFGASEEAWEETSYVERLGNWSMSYGTVQVAAARAKENAREDGEAQWRRYMRRGGRGTPPGDWHVNQGRPELVVTTSLSDISVVPTNTFRRQAGSPQERSSAFEPAMAVVDSDDDPAQAAKDVFENVLRQQKSNFFSMRDAGEPRSGDSGGDSDADFFVGGRTESQLNGLESRTASSSSFHSEPLSPSPPGSQARDSESRQAKLKLITPEDAGMVFDHEHGVWEPLEGLQKRTVSSTNIGASHTVNTSLSYEETGDSRTPNHAVRSDSYVYQDDTPLAPPQLAEKFKIPADVTSTGEHSVTASEQLISQGAPRTAYLTGVNISPGNVTDIQQLETSFSLSQSAVVRVLLDVIPNKQDWANVEELELSGKQLSTLIGLDQVVRNCFTLDVSNNELNSLQGVPAGCIHLNCSNNGIGSYMSLTHLPHLETLCLSNNKLNHKNLSLLEPCRHLKVVDLSFNSISGLHYLPTKAHVQKLNLSHNKLAGVVDFLQLCKESIAWRHIEELDLSGNKITCVRNLAYLAHLRILRLDGNPIEVIDGEGNAQIRTLTMTNNPALQTVEGFPALRILKCRGESLQLVGGSLPETLETLEIVGGYKNSFKRWNWPEVLPKYLRTLRLRRMQLSAVPPIISRIPLRSLDLSHNCIINTTQLLHALPNTLQELNLFGNPLWAANDTDRRMLVEAVRLYIFSLRGI